MCNTYCFAAKGVTLNAPRVALHVSVDFFFPVLDGWICGLIKPTAIIVIPELVHYEGQQVSDV